MTAWCSLYLPCADNANQAEKVSEILQETLTALGYELYNPFGLIPGKAYPQAVRLFVAPANERWTRVLGTPDPALLPALSRLAPCLLAELDGGEARIEAYADGSSSTPQAAFARCASSPDCISRALAEGETVNSPDAAVGGVPFDALPDDVQALAGRVDLKQAGALFARLSGSLAQKHGADPAARDLLRQPQWGSAGGARISALMDCLRIADWRDPDFVTLRDAYALHERRRRSPKATLYPGDADALAAVSDALRYTPVYAGKR